MLMIKIKRLPRGWASYRLTLYENGVFVDDMDYMYCNKREMIRDFKERTGIKGKHGAKIMEVTK